MDRTCQFARAPDGRALTFAEWGNLDGQPVFLLHGTPGCRLARHPNEELVRSTGARVITYDRAGYGRSDRHRGRTVADDASDVAAIADSLGIGRFAVEGGSGGGRTPWRRLRCSATGLPGPHAWWVWRRMTRSGTAGSPAWTR